MYRLSAVELNKAFLEGKYSAEEICSYFLKRIHRFDKQLGTFITILDERAMKKASMLDEKKKNNKPLGRLAGVPICIKDNQNIKDIVTTCGSKILENYKALNDATAIKLLEAEDAIIIGKTNLDEFAMGSSTEYSSFFPTRNPWNLGCTPGGSSGGSSAAVAARLCPIGTGSDTGGSIRQPASLCGIVGYKPSYGRISRYGLVALASSWDQIGTLTNTVEDCALMMEILAKHCPNDGTSINAPFESYLKQMPSSLEGTTIGVPWHFLKDLNKETLDNFKESIEIVKSLGAKIIEVDLDLIKYCIAVYHILQTAEASTNLARYDGIRYGMRSKKANTIDEVYYLSRDEGFGQEVKNRIFVGTYVLSTGFIDAYYKKAQKVRKLIIDHINKIFEKCDLISMPTTSSPAFEINTIQDPVEMYLQDIFTVPANLAGTPAISVPSGFSKEKKLPFGIQFMGPRMQDVKVIHTAYAFEQKTKHNTLIPPLFDKGE